MPRSFVIFQAVLAITVAMFQTSSGDDAAIVYGVLGGQAALSGLYLGLGTSREPTRLAAALAVLAWSAVILLLRPHFIGRVLLVLGLQAALTAAVLWWWRLTSGCVFASRDVGEEGLPGQFAVRHLLALTFAVAFVLGTAPYVAGTSIGKYLMVGLVAVGFAAISLVACWAVFGSGSTLWRALAASAAILLVASALTYFGFCQADSIRLALVWLLWSTSEAAFTVLSCWWLRRMGWRVGRPLASVPPEVF